MHYCLRLDCGDDLLRIDFHLLDRERLQETSQVSLRSLGKSLQSTVINQRLTKIVRDLPRTSYLDLRISRLTLEWSKNWSNRLVI